MAIYKGNKKGILFKGDYHPAEFYKGSQKIAGYNIAEKTGTEISVDNTYNDVLSPVIEGKSYQAVTTNSPTPDNPSPIILSEGSDVVFEGTNTAPITLPLPESFGGVGNISDRIYGENGKVWWEKNNMFYFPADVYRVRLLDGYENDVSKLYYITGFSNQKSNNGMISDRFVYGAAVGKTTTINCLQPNMNGNQLYLRIRNDLGIANRDMLFNYLVENDVKFYGQLATPQLIDITDTPTGQAYLKLQTYYPYTHIYSTAQDNVKPILQAEIKQF